MHRLNLSAPMVFGLLGVFALLAGCETTERAPFDPEADKRVGAEVTRACYPQTGGAGGGYVEVGGYDGYLIGRRSERYLLIFSRGCGSLGPAGDAVVFRNIGDHCRRKGEPVKTFSAGLGVSGACTIQHIYEWDRDADEEGTSDVSD